MADHLREPAVAELFALAQGSPTQENTQLNTQAGEEASAQDVQPPPITAAAAVRDDTAVDVRGKPFVALVPIDSTAKINFDELCEVLRNEDARHHRNFIEVDPIKIALIMDASFSASDTDADVDAQVSDACVPRLDIWTGRYVFPLNPLPLNPAIGWIVGTGDFNKNNSTGLVDIRVAPVAAEGSKMHRRHARLSFNQDGVLYLEPLNGYVAVNGRPVTRHTHHLLSSDDTITIGSATYQVQFPQRSDEEQSAWHEAMTDYLRVNLQANAPHPAVSATPTPLNPVVNGWELRAITAANKKTTIKAAIRQKDSATAACKVLPRYDHETAKKADDEVRTYQSVADALKVLDHPGTAYIRRLEEVFWSEGCKEWNSSRKDEVYLFWRPFAFETLRSRLRDVRQRPLSMDAKLCLFAQLLLALDALHAAGFIHRDLKAHNIMLLSDHQLTIIDLENAVESTNGLTPDPGTWGTIGYLAPEAENVVFSSKYGPPVDVFSAGIVGHHLFAGTPEWDYIKCNIFQRCTTSTLPTWSPLGADDVEQKLSKFGLWLEDMQESASPTSIEDLLHQMLEPDPLKRITVRATLKHPSVAAAAIEVRARDATTGQTRPHTND